VSAHGNKQKYASQNPIQRFLLGRFLDNVVDLVRSTGARTVLDVGCGEGYVLNRLAEADLDLELMGLDMSGDAVADARELLGERATVMVGDARDPPFDRTFDLVLMTEVLEHIPQPENMLPVLEALSHGHLVLSVPWEPFFMGLNFMRGKHLRAWGNDPEHVNHWGRRGFQRFVGSRFEILAAPNVFPWTLVLARLRR
jgi:2-polyprenyl-3-methyl-5-hydroxy-6-metoxy-1,4-benzoquinol methylase